MRLIAARLIPAVLAFVAGVSADAILSDSRTPEPALVINQMVATVISTRTETEWGGEPEFNPTGDYELPKNPPQGFENITWISFETAELPYQADRWVAIPPRGFVYEPGRKYHMTRINLDGVRLSFSTESVAGVSYDFTGRFTGGGVFYDRDPTGLVLRGSITKNLNGRALVRSEVNITRYGRR